MLAKQPSGQFRDRDAIIDVARRELQDQQLALIVDHEVELETVESTHRGLTPAATLDDGRLEGLSSQLRHLQRRLLKKVGKKRYVIGAGGRAWRSRERDFWPMIPA